MKQFDTYDDEINSGNRWVLILFVGMIVFLGSMIYVSALETKGGVFNGGFEYGTGSRTSSWIGSESYGWLLGNSTGTVTVDYNSTYKHSGNQSLRLVTSNSRARLTHFSTASTISASSTYLYKLIPIKPLTTYKLCYWTKMNTDDGNGLVSAVTGVTSTFADSTETHTQIRPTNSADFVENCGTFIPGSTAKYVRIMFYTGYNSATSNTGEMFIDDITVSEVDTLSLSTQQQGRPSLTITGVTDTNAIDQSQTTTDSTVVDGNTSNETREYFQIFKPTQTKLTGITLNKSTTGGTPTGNLVIELRDVNSGGYPTSTVFASKTFTLSEWNAYANGEVFIPLPAIVTPDKNYAIYTRDSNANEKDGDFYRISINTSDNYSRGIMGRYRPTTGSWTFYPTYDLYFKTHFAKLSSSVDLNVVAPDGTSELKSFDVNGDILTDANITINPNGTGRYNYVGSTLASTGSHAFHDAYSLYRVSALAGHEYEFSLSELYDVNAVYKITLPQGCSIDGNAIYRFTGNTTAGRYFTLSHSTNNSTWILDANHDGTSCPDYGACNYTSFNADGNTQLYLKLADDVGSTTYITYVWFDANLSCPSLTTPLFKNGTNTIYTMNKDTNWFSPAWTNTPITDTNATTAFKGIPAIDPAINIYFPMTNLKITDLNQNVITAAKVDVNYGDDTSSGKIRLAYYYTDGTVSYSEEQNVTSETMTTKTFSTFSTPTKDVNKVEAEIKSTFGYGVPYYTKNLIITYSSFYGGYKTTLTPSLMSNLTFNFFAPTTSISNTAFADNNNYTTITITCTDTNVGCVNNYYQIDDGTVVSSASNPYIFDLNLLGSHTITYWSSNNYDSNSLPQTLDINFPTLLTIFKPVDILTMVTITENWNLRADGGVTLDLTNIPGDYNVYIQANVATNFYIGDSNGNYTPNTYAKSYYTDSNTGYDTLQPYLYALATSLVTTINVRSAITNQPIQNVTIKVYGTLPGIGYTLVGQGITDSKGQILQLFITGQSYTFDLYYGGVLIKTFNITATSTTIYILLDIGAIPIPPTPQSVFTANWTPIPNLLKQYSGTQVFTQTLNNIDSNTISIVSTLQQDGADLGASQNYSGSSNKTFTYTINWADIGTLPITSKMVVTDSSGNIYTFTQTYLVNVSDSNTYGGTYNPLTGLQTGLRKDLACEWDTPLYYLTPCFPLFFIALIISIALVIWASIMLGQFNGQAAGLIFLVSMILFTFLTWIPVYVTAGLVLIMLAFLLNDRGGQ